MLNFLISEVKDFPIILNDDSQRLYDSLPSISQIAICTTQKMLQQTCISKGIEGRISSAFRSPSYNSKTHGSINSRHIFGAAFDICLMKAKGLQSGVHGNLKVVKEVDHWHVELL